MKNDEFEIFRVDNPDGVKFNLKGFITSYYADTLQNELDKTLKDGVVNIILNMLFVEYICSTGIKVLLKTFKSAKEAGGKLSIEMPSERVKNVLGMVALDEMLIK